MNLDIFCSWEASRTDLGGKSGEIEMTGGAAELVLELVLGLILGLELELELVELEMFGEAEERGEPFVVVADSSEGFPERSIGIDLCAAS